MFCLRDHAFGRLSPASLGNLPSLGSPSVSDCRALFSDWEGLPILFGSRQGIINTYN